MIAKITAHPDSGFLGRVIAENEKWKPPDFRPWGRVFQLCVQSGVCEINRGPHSTRHRERIGFCGPVRVVLRFMPFPWALLEGERPPVRLPGIPA